MKVKLTLIGLFINYIFSIGQNGNAASLTTKVSRNTDTIDLISLAFSFNGKGVNEDIQKLKSIAYSIEVHDTNRMAAFLNIAKFYIDINNDTSLVYAQESKKLAQKFKLIHFEAQINDFMGAVHIRMGNSAEGLELLLKAEKVFSEAADSTFLIVVNRNLGSLYKIQTEYNTAKNYYFKALAIRPKSTADSIFRSWALMDLGELYLQENQIDSAYFFTKESNDISYKISILYSKKYVPIAQNNLGKILEKKGDYKGALELFHSGIQVAKTNFNSQAVGDIYLSLTGLFKQINRLDSAFYYAKKSYQIAANVNNPALIEKSSAFLKDFFKAQNQIDSAFYYQNIMISAMNTNRDADKIKQVQNVAFRELFKEQQLKTEKVNFRNKIILFSLSSILGIVLLTGYFLYKSNKEKQKANILLQYQKGEIQSTLSQLKATQNQLIQKEKLASLGELTAGIAHEIQNPLNFVNNFSELSVDLVKDLKDEIEKPDQDKPYINELFDDLSQNQEKINHHGKRASSIVKGMLEHSRASTGERELTDINALADEYLRLSYHGMRAKNKDFNADYQTDFDENLPRINVIPQDIGRVLLNLINNAFYAVHERNLRGFENLAGLETYAPSVLVSTQQLDNQIIIKVKDNGNGIPENIKAKIFQPFFTTKPTGQGTGLGLSLAYDIVTKGHGGTLEVFSKEGEGSEFIIGLPFKIN